MRYIEDRLESLDNYFSNKSESEKWLIILLLAGVVGYILYLYLFPYAESRYKNSRMTQQRLEKRIAEEERYLRSITVNGDRNFYIKKYDRDIARKKQEIRSYEQKIARLNQSFSKLSEVLFNRKNWATFLNSITARARANDVELLELTNHYVHDKRSFGHVLEMGIRCEGAFQNIMAFINDLEQNKLVTDVYSSDLFVDPETKKVVADLNVSVWGVNR